MSPLFAVTRLMVFRVRVMRASSHVEGFSNRKWSFPTYTPFTSRFPTNRSTPARVRTRRSRPRNWSDRYASVSSMNLPLVMDERLSAGHPARYRFSFALYSRSFTMSEPTARSTTSSVTTSAARKVQSRSSRRSALLFCFWRFLSAMVGTPCQGGSRTQT